MGRGWAWRTGGRPGPQLPMTCSFDACSLSSVNRELVRKASRKDHLVVHSSMERDVGLLRLYPGIPAALVGKPWNPLPSSALMAPMRSCLLGLPGAIDSLPLSRAFLRPRSANHDSLPIWAPFCLSWARLFPG